MAIKHIAPKPNRSVSRIPRPPCLGCEDTMCRCHAPAPLAPTRPPLDWKVARDRRALNGEGLYPSKDRCPMFIYVIVSLKGDMVLMLDPAQTLREGAERYYGKDCVTLEDGLRLNVSVGGERVAYIQKVHLPY